jgi:hypothetical protein
LGWLLDRDYSLPSALKLVGDRYQLEDRQRLAVMRSACSASQQARRARHRASDDDLNGQRVLIDGYNILTTVEAALAGGVLFIGRDGCIRDLASMHGTWRKVSETRPALTLVGEHLAARGVLECRWLLDSPVSNSGRLKQIIEATGREHGWNWAAELAQNPDVILSVAADIVITADSAILDRCRRWWNLTPELLARRRDAAWLVDLWT